MLKELVVKNRSYRTYDRSVKVTKEQMLEFINNARLTPSTVNLQPILYIPLEEALADKILPYTAWA